MTMMASVVLQITLEKASQFSTRVSGEQGTIGSADGKLHLGLFLEGAEVCSQSLTGFEQHKIQFMKRDRPIILLNKSKILLQTFQEDYREAYNLLVQIAEPHSRPVFIHQFQFTVQSLIKAMTLGYDYKRVIKELSRYMQNEDIPSQMCRYIKTNTQKFGCARLELKEISTEEGNKLVHVLEIENDIYCDIGGLSGIEKEIFSYESHLSKKLILEDDYTIATRKLNQHKIPVIFQHRYQTQDFEQEEQFIPKSFSFEIELKPFAQLRYYQQDSLKSIFEGENKAKSGIIVLPCGAGKTLLGIAIAVRIKRSTLVICNGDASVQQWKTQFLKWTSGLDPKMIIKLTGKSQKEQTFRKRQEPFIVITSYPYLNSKLNKKDKPGHEEHRIKNLLWGLCILDQVQCLPANQYKEIIHKFKAHVKIGLTATPYREDQRFNSLDYLIGPTLYEANWLDFIKEGHLANPYCVQVRIPYREPLPLAPFEKDHRKKLLIENPLKFKTLMYLLKVHEEKGDFIIVFCDYVPLIQYYARSFRKPVVCGETPEEDRRFIFDMFRKGVFRTVFLCRVGDEGIDLPNASVGIELTMFGRSRKQAVQRLGRIMRPKDSTSKGYNSFFYTFVSNIPMEMQYFYTRQKCLADLGFPHGIIKQQDLPYNDPEKPQSRWFREKQLKEIGEFKEWLRAEQQKIIDK